MTKKSRQDRSGLARLTGAGKKKARDMPHVPQRVIKPAEKRIDGSVRKPEKVHKTRSTKKDT